jgi:hypothetical protein
VMSFNGALEIGVMDAVFGADGGVTVFRSVAQADTRRPAVRQQSMRQG